MNPNPWYDSAAYRRLGVLRQAPVGISKPCGAKGETRQPEGGLKRCSRPANQSPSGFGSLPVIAGCTMACGAWPLALRRQKCAGWRGPHRFSGHNANQRRLHVRGSAIVSGRPSTLCHGCASLGLQEATGGGALPGVRRPAHRRSKSVDTQHIPGGAPSLKRAISTRLPVMSCVFLQPRSVASPSHTSLTPTPKREYAQNISGIEQTLHADVQRTLAP